MAGDWIKMRGNLWDDPRVGAIVDATDTSEAMVIGGLYWLWATADQHTEDGIMPGLSLRQIDRKTGIPGFAAALVALGWLAEHPEGVRIVKFEEHNGASAKKRATTAKRVAGHRAGNADENESDPPANADVTLPALQTDDASVTGALARDREEIDREKKEEKTGESRASAPRATRHCPEAFQVTAELVAWAAVNTPAVDLAVATATFKDHTFKTAITDWPGAWRNWMRRDQKYFDERSQPRKPASPTTGKHTGFASKNYREGVHADGSFT